MTINTANLPDPTQDPRYLALSQQWDSQIATFDADPNSGDTVDPSDPRYQAIVAQYSAQITDLQAQQTAANSVMQAVFQRRPDLATADYAASGWQGHPDDPDCVICAGSDAQQTSLGNQITQLQQQQAQALSQLSHADGDAAMQTQKSQALAAMAAEINTDNEGAAMIAEAQQAGSSVNVDLNGMDLTDMLMMVFAASNQVKEGLTEEEVGQLNDQNQEVGTLTDLMSQISDQVPPNPDSTPETVDSSVLDTLKASGVEIPAYTTSADGKTSTMAASDLSKLVDNIKSVIDTTSNNTQLAIQGITKCNNDIAENYQVMSTTQSDVHQSKMGLASGH